MPVKEPYNGMLLSTLEGLGTVSQPAIDKLINLQSKGVPHFSKLQDPDIRLAIFDTGQAYNFKDNNDNIIVIGNARWHGNNENDPDTFLMILRKGLYQPEWVMSSIPRSTGGGGIERDVNFMMKDYKVNRGASNTALDIYKQLNINPNETGWYELLQIIEDKKIKYNHPLVFIRGDQKVYSLKSIYTNIKSTLESALMVIAIAISVVGTGGASLALIATITTGAKALFAAADVAINGGSTADLVKGVTSIANLIMPSLDLEDVKKQVADVLPADYTKYVEQGMDIYNKVNSKNSLGLLGLHGLDCTEDVNTLSGFNDLLDMAETLADSYKSGDVSSIVKLTGIDINDIEPVVRTFTTLHTSSGLQETLSNPELLLSQNSFENPHINNFVITTYVSLLQKNGSNLNSITAGYPNTIDAIKSIAGTNKLAPNEFSALTNVVQGLPANAKDMKLLAIQSVFAQAKSYENTSVEFVIPSSIPPSVQLEAMKMIKSELKNIKVTSTNPDVMRAFSNRQEFI